MYLVLETKCFGQREAKKKDQHHRTGFGNRDDWGNTDVKNMGSEALSFIS